MTEEYLSTILSDQDLGDSPSLQLLETLYSLQPHVDQESIFDGIDLHLECEDDDFDQPLYWEESKLIPHTVIGQNVCLRVSFPSPTDGLETKVATFKCSHCESAFTRRYKLARHLLDVHEVTKNFQCVECQFATTSTRLLRRHCQRGHIKTNKGTKLEESDVAGLSFSPDDADMTLKETFTNSHFCSLKSDDSSCDNANVDRKVSSTSGVLHSDKSQSVSSGRFLFICSECPYKCDNLGSLNSHASHKHNPDRKDFACAQCSFTCKQKRTFVIHQKTHSDEAPIYCNVCKKTFLVDSALKRHAKTHTNEKSFLCTHENCNKSFRVNELLKGHISRVHGNDNSKGIKSRNSLFLCSWEGCNKTFRDNYNLKAHYCRHTGDKHMQCGQCNFTCVQRASLNHHVKKTHS